MVKQKGYKPTLKMPSLEAPGGGGPHRNVPCHPKTQKAQVLVYDKVHGPKWETGAELLLKSAAH